MLSVAPKIPVPESPELLVSSAPELEALPVVAQRVLAGSSNEGESRQAQSNVSAAAEELASLEEQIGLTRNRLAALAGEGPDRGSSLERPAASIGAGFGLPEGFFIGPYAAEGKASMGTFKQPTSTLLADVATTGIDDLVFAQVALGKRLVILPQPL